MDNKCMEISIYNQGVIKKTETMSAKNNMKNK